MISSSCDNYNYRSQSNLYYAFRLEIIIQTIHLEDARDTKAINLRSHIGFDVVLVPDEVVPKSILAKQDLLKKNIHKSLKNEGD